MTTDSLRILVLAPYVPRIGYHAGGKLMFEHLRHLAAFGHRITLVAIFYDETEFRSAEALKPIVERLHLFPSTQNRGAHDPFYILTENYRTPEIVACIEDEIEHCDLLFVEYHKIANLLPDSRRVPAVLFHHEVQTTAWLDYAHTFPWFSTQRLRHLYTAARNYQAEKNILARFDRVLALTEGDVDVLKRISPKYKHKVALSRFGVDLDEFPPCTMTPKPHELLFVGYFNHHPNVDAARYLANDVMPLLIARFPDVHLTLAGAAPTLEVLAMQNEHITVTGRVPDLRPYYEQAALFVAPITTGRGIRGKIIETMALQRPVVATPLAVAGFGLIDGTHAAVADSPQVFAEAIADLFAHPDQAAKMAKEARALMKKLDWKDCIRDMETCFFETIREYKDQHDA